MLLNHLNDDEYLKEGGERGKEDARSGSIKQIIEMALVLVVVVPFAALAQLLGARRARGLDDVPGFQENLVYTDE
jgi:hypothetical protein